MQKKQTSNVELNENLKRLKFCDDLAMSNNVGLCA